MGESFGVEVEDMVELALGRRVQLGRVRYHVSVPASCDCNEYFKILTCCGWIRARLFHRSSFKFDRVIIRRPKADVHRSPAICDVSSCLCGLISAIPEVVVSDEVHDLTL